MSDFGWVFLCGFALLPVVVIILMVDLWKRVGRLEAEMANFRDRPLAAPSPVAVAPTVPPSLQRSPAVDAPSAAPPQAVPPATPPGRPASTLRPVTLADASEALPMERPAAAVARAVSPPAVAAPSAPPTRPSPQSAPPPPPAARRASPSLEQIIGGRLPVWIGAIAVALAGIFLFKYAIDEGYFGPTARVLTGIAAGMTLLAVAERLRRQSHSVAGGTAAAGIAVLYASVLAATNLYALVSVWAGGLAMAAITAGAVALSLRFGPVVVVVGLVGGFLTPALLETETDSPLQLFGYLSLLQVGVLAVARRRGWWWLGPLVLGGGTLWALTWLYGGRMEPADGSTLGTFALLGGAASILAMGRAGGASAHPRARAAGWLGTAYAGLLLSLSIQASGYRPADWLFFAILGAGALSLARLSEAWQDLPWLTAALTALILIFSGESVGQGTALPLAWWLAPAFGALYALTAYAFMLRGPRPGPWARLLAVMTVGYFMVARFVQWPSEPGEPWGLAAAGLAMVLALGAAPWARRRLAAVASGASELGGEEADSLVPMGLAAVTLLALAAAIDLEHWWLVTAWAAIAAGAAEVGRRLRLPILAYAAVAVAALSTLALFGTVGLEGYPVSAVPVANTILLGYGAVIALLMVAAASADGVWAGPVEPPTGPAERQPAITLRWLALALTVIMAHLLISHGFHPEEGVALHAPASDSSGLVEWTAHLLAPLALAAGLLAASRRRPWQALTLGGPIVAWSALGLGVVIILLALEADIKMEHWWIVVAWAAITAGAAEAGRRLRQPVLAYAAMPAAALATSALLGAFGLERYPAGHVPLVNGILLGYGTVIALLLAAAASADRMWAGPTSTEAGHVERQPARTLRWLGLVLTVAMVHLLIGHGFHPRDGVELRSPGTGGLAIVEWTAHLVAPIVLALGLLSASRRRPWQALAIGGQVLAWSALAAGVIVGLVVANPLWSDLPVGEAPVVNLLLLAYAIPAALWLLVARRRRAEGDGSPLPAAAAAMAGVLGFALVSLEVRQAFHGSVLTTGETTLAEQVGYSLSWILYGLALLGIGIRRASPAARYASLAVMIVAVCKVFLLDASGLTGLYRVFSFLGLGVSLLGLAYVYQRFVIAPRVTMVE